MKTLTFVLMLSLVGTVFGLGCSKISKSGIDLIIKFTPLERSPIDDSDGKLSVGYGYVCKLQDCEEVPFKFPLKKTTAKKYLKRVILADVVCLSKALDEKLTFYQPQWEALVSWANSVGCTEMRNSNLTKRLNAGEDPKKVVAEELPTYKKAKGTTNDQSERRQAEVNLFNEESKIQAFPTCKKL